MSLREKLSTISKTIEEKKLNQKKEEQESKLSPIREKIKSLEELRVSLEMIKNSLSGEDIKKTLTQKTTDKESVGLGMKEYAASTDQNLKNKKNKIEEILSENTEAMESLGISKTDDLISHPDFSSDEEVVALKKGREQKDSLLVSDESLKQRLAALGLEINEVDGSYDSVRKVVDVKLDQLDQEIATEKIKTPEGRQEVIEKLASQIGKDSHSMIFEKKGGSAELEFNRNAYSGPKLIASGEKVTLINWSQSNLIPSTFNKIKEEHEDELSEEALVFFYQKKVESLVKNYEKTHENDQGLKEKLDNNLKEKASTLQAIKEFIKQRDKLSATLEKKSTDLSQKGIKFNSVSISGYGGKYKDLLLLDASQDAEKILQEVEADDFPPRYDLVKMQELVLSRTKAIEEFTAQVENMKTEEDVEALTYGQKSPVGNLHGNQLKQNTKYVNFDFKITDAGREYYDNLQELEKNHKYCSEVLKILDQRIKDNEIVIEKFSEKITLAVKANLIEQRYRQQATEFNFDQEINRFEQNNKRIESNKQLALEEIKKIGTDKINIQETLNKLGLSDKEVVIEGVNGRIPAVLEKQAAENTAAKEKKEELNVLENKIAKHLAAKPKIFGKDTWQSELDKLNENRKSLEAGVEQALVQAKSYFQDGYFSLSIDSRGNIAWSLDKIKFQGSVDDVFKNIEKLITEKYIDKKVPESIQRMYTEYQQLTQKI